MPKKPFTGQDLSGRTFGRLTVIKWNGLHGDSNGNLKSKWECVCQCGVTKSIYGKSLLVGNTKSCGCLQIESVTALMLKHGGKRKNQQHPLYRRWRGMIERCEQVNHSHYSSYGGRGINVCARWHDFGLWLEDMGPAFSPGLEIERKDNSGNYEPDNCMWATKIEQANNRRNNRLITHLGETLTIAQWAGRLNMPQNLISTRLYAGWSDTAALSPQRA